jgi:hypothetical protein
MTHNNEEAVVMTEIAKAEHVLNNLRHKRDALVAHGIELGEQRQHVAFDAHTGDAAARKKLDTINRETALQDSELHSLDAAIGEATKRLAASQAAEAQAANRQRAAEAQKLVRELGEVFPYLDRKLAEAARALIAINDGVQKLHELGFAAPSDAQIRLAVAAVIQSWAHGIPKSWHDQLRDGLQFLAPHERKTATQYWEAVEGALQNAIRQHAGEAPVSEQPKQKAVA